MVSRVAHRCSAALQSRSQYVHHLLRRFHGRNRQLLDDYWVPNEKLIGFGTGHRAPIDCRRVFRLEPNSYRVMRVPPWPFFTEVVHILGARLGAAPRGVMLRLSEALFQINLRTISALSRELKEGQQKTLRI